MKEIITTGKTIEEALDKAVLELNKDSSEIEFEVLEAPTTGFLGFGAKLAKIVARCDVKKALEKPVIEKPSFKEFKKAPYKEESRDKIERPRRQERTDRFEKSESPQRFETAARTERAETAEDEVFVPSENGVGFVTAYFDNLFKHIKYNVTYSVKQTGRIIEVELTGEEVGAVIGKHGDTLDAIQHLAQLAFNKGVKGGEKVRVDTENYREKREKTLVGLAKSIANRVIKSRAKYELEPMKAYERRIIHAALQSYPMLTTYSVGNEPQRRIIIAYKHR